MQSLDKALLISIVLLSLLITLKLFHAELPSVQQSKQLVVITHSGPNTYYIQDEGHFAGFEYDLSRAFAAFLGPEYQVRFVVKNHLYQVIDGLIAGQGHFAAANLSITPKRQQQVQFGMPYLDVQQRIVFNTETDSAPEQLSDLVGKHIEVPRGSSYAERLHALAKQLRALRWHPHRTASSEELVEQVCAGTLDYTVMDDLMATLLQNYYPNLGLGLAIGPQEKIAWAFPQQADPWLYEQSKRFFQQIKANGELQKIVERYYGHIDRLNPADVRQFLLQMRQTLPRYTPLFKQAQENTGMDWRLIAAVSYQESHWDQLNTSPTNVRGMMMLTEQTADSLGVTDRLDAKQSILGGAQYLLQLKDQLPSQIQEPDRTWMTLAAYNIGMSHLEDARKLTQSLGRNPNQWADVKATLPLLNQAQYYQQLKFGYASGGAPVIFVESIRTYYSILNHYAPAHQPFSLFSLWH